jgi:hypothetical protein
LMGISLVVSEDGFVVCCVCAMARVRGLRVTHAAL